MISNQILRDPFYHNGTDEMCMKNIIYKMNSQIYCIKILD